MSVTGVLTRLAFRYAAAPMAEETEWLDVDAGARYLDLHENTIYRLVRDVKPPVLPRSSSPGDGPCVLARSGVVLLVAYRRPPKAGQRRSR